jgi:ArsR family transcriptional regulator
LELLQGGEKCTCKLIEEMDMPQSTLSYHMKVLVESGVVVGRQDGKWTHYHISEQGGLAAMAILHGLLMSSLIQRQNDPCCVK